MSKADLMKLMGDSSVHTLYDELPLKMKKASIVNLYTIHGECIKIKGEKNISVIDITPHYVTVQFDSHVSDFLYTGIEKIEYY